MIDALDEARARIAEGWRVVVSVSGGKDSTATALALREVGIEFSAAFADTGWEHPSTYEYVRDVLPGAIGVAPVWVRADVEVPEEWAADVAALESRLGFVSPFVRRCVRGGAFPRRTGRWCSPDLKHAPLRRHLAQLGGMAISAQGIRAEESAARAAYLPWDGDAAVWRPIIRWSVDDVIAIHQRHGIRPNPLYLQGAERVGCWPCIFSRKAEIRRIADTDDTRVSVIRDLEDLVRRVAQRRIERDGDKVAGKSGKLRSELPPPALFQAPLREYAGDGQCWPIDRVVEWSRTSRGGRQVELFEARGEERSGCMRWGMCDVGGA